MHSADVVAVALKWLGVDKDMHQPAVALAERTVARLQGEAAQPQLRLIQGGASPTPSPAGRQGTINGGAAS